MQTSCKLVQWKLETSIINLTILSYLIASLIKEVVHFPYGIFWLHNLLASCNSVCHLQATCVAQTTRFTIVLTVINYVQRLVFACLRQVQVGEIERFVEFTVLKTTTSSNDLEVNVKNTTCCH